ncbi:MAG: hypothetical protein JWL65_5785 [Gammaproteobacteria bacterium]|nr:hypothetical protein [Gammaproteobacteria bacterium]
MYLPRNTEPHLNTPPLAARLGPIAAAVSALRDPAGIARLGWAFAAFFGAAYAVYIAQLTSLPFQDYPNHLVRGAVMADLLFDHGTRFGRIFDFQLIPVPYILHDLLLAGCVEIFGPVVGAGFFSTLVLLSLPCALLFYMHVNHLAPQARWLVLLISLYLSSDWFFLAGFTAFRLSLAMIVVNLALADALRRRLSAPLFGLYVLVLLLGYLIHLSSLVFFTTALAVSGLVRLLFRRTIARVEVYLLIPAAALLALHFGVLVEPYGATNPREYRYDWGDLSQKFHGLIYEFERYDGKLSKPMMIALAGCLLWPIRRDLNRRALRKSEVVEQLALAVVFLGIYIVLPRAYADATFVDIRALPMVTLFLLFACLYLADEHSSGREFNTLPMLVFSTLLVVANFAYLAVHLSNGNAMVARFRAVVTAIPRGSYVLPVYTQPMYTLSPLLHADSYAVLDRGAVTPTLFSRDRGDPMKYFRYRHRPYMPDESWYLTLDKWDKATEATYTVEGQTYRWRFSFSEKHGQWTMMDVAPVDWDRIACDYDFLLVTRPFDAAHIRVATTTAAANETAALLAVDKQECHPARQQRHQVQLPNEH